MILLLRLFNSATFMFINLTVALYTCKRFFRVMRAHYKLVAEVAEFNSIVCQARSSLEYVGSKVSEAMKEIEGDIGKELHVTQLLTKLSSKMSSMLKRFTNLEEGVIELVRMEHNTDNAKVETPTSINDEVKKVLTSTRKKSISKFSKFSQPPSIPAGNYELEFSGSKLPSGKFTTCAPMSVNDQPTSENSTSKDKQELSSKPRTSVFPVVQLLSEQKRHSEAKPIGFRPNWKFEA